MLYVAGLQELIPTCVYDLILSSIHDPSLIPSSHQIGSGVFGLKTASSGSVLQFASRTVRQDVENVDTGRTASPKAIHDLELVHTRLYTESKSIGGGRGLCSTCANEKTTNAQH